MSANIIDEDTVIFRMRINTQEINCKISTKDGNIVEGKTNFVQNIFYIFDITVNPEPLVEEVGHFYHIVSMIRTGVTKQLL